MDPRTVRFAIWRGPAGGVSMLAGLAVMVLSLCLAVPAARAGLALQEVRSESGVEAWLVEDYSVPIVTIRFAFSGGSAAEPEGKEGLSKLLVSLFDEGAGELDSEAFQIRLDDAGAEMSFSAGRDTIYGSMRVLAENRAEAFDLLRLAVTEPRFDAVPVERMKGQMLAGLRASENDPDTLAGRRWLRALYGDHPYARPEQGTPETLAGIAPDDLRAFHRAAFVRDGLNVAVVGAIDAETLATELDRIFGGLPETSDLPAVADVDQKLDQQVRYDYPLPQARLRLSYPGLARDDPQFFAAALMNQILGGGSFTSRLFQEVREKRGLAYGVDSGLSTLRHANSLVIGTSTRADKAEETLGVIREVVRRMAEEGPTAEELEAAKQYIIGAYAVNNLESSASIAATLVQLQIDDLGIDYIDRRADLINAVTLEDTKAVARRLLSAEPAVLVVGPSAPEAGPASDKALDPMPEPAEPALEPAE